MGFIDIIKNKRTTEERKIEQIKAVLDKNPELVNATTDYGHTPIIFAAMGGYAKVIKELYADGAEVNAKDKEEWTALHYAAGLRNYKCDPIISELLEHGADVNIGNKNGNRPVHTAAEKGNALAVKLLVRKCSDTTCARNNNGETPLHMAARSQTINSGIKIIRLLLKFDNTDINAKDKNGNTPLHCATHSGHVKYVRSFIIHGAEVNARNDDKETPLHCAVKSGKANIVEALLLVDANIMAKDKNDKTPLDLARTGGDREIIALLRVAQRTTKSPKSDVSKTVIKGFEQLSL